MPSARVRNLALGALVFGGLVLGIQVFGSGPATTDTSTTPSSVTAPTTATTVPNPVAGVLCPPGTVARSVPGAVPTSSYQGYAWMPAVDATSGWCLVKQ